MADNMTSGPTSYGQKVGGIKSFLFGTDPYLSNISTRTQPQEIAQQGILLPQALMRLSTGFNAPSIAPAAREAQRQFREETIPGLMEQFAGGGSQGALLRGIQGAGSDLQSKLGALQMQQQFELQKQRQEQLPRLMELGLAPSFQPMLTDRPIHPEFTRNPETGQIEYSQTSGLPFSTIAARNPRVQEFLKQARLAGEEAAMAGAKGIEAARTGARAGATLGEDILSGDLYKRAKASLQKGGYKATPEVMDYIKDVMARAKLPASERVKGEVFPNRFASDIKKKFRSQMHGKNVNPDLARLLRDEHNPIIEDILKHKRKRWGQAFRRTKTIEDLMRLHKLSKEKKVSNDQLDAYIKSLRKG